MISRPILSFVLVLVSTLPAGMVRASVVERLTCEYLVNPVGIDATQPRLSWLLQSPERGARQTAYRILVASSADALHRDEGDLWNTGKIVSDQSVQVPYAGKPLPSDLRCFWKVQVWDEQNRRSPWSSPATWTMGILKPEQWLGKWITNTPPTAALHTQALDFTGSGWIWFPEGDPHVLAPAGTRWFRRTFSIPPGAKVQSGRLLITADDRFTAFINGVSVGKSSAEGEAWSQPQEIDIASHLQPGQNAIAIEARNDAVSPAGVLAKLDVRMADGTNLIIPTDAAWRCTDANADGWLMPSFNDNGWRPVKVLGPEGMAPWGKLRTSAASDWGAEPPSPIFRKAFTAPKPIQHATVTICGLGYYELRLNGAKVEDHELDPAFTRYDKRCLYVTYDVTNQLRRGENAVGVMLGNGFYNQYSRDAWNFQNAGWRDRPKLLFQLRMDYVDGTHDTLVSDTTWRSSTGPIIQDGIRNGEFYDARQEKTGWDQPGYDDSKWAVAQTVAPPQGHLRAQMLPPIRVVQTLQPVGLTEPKPGVFIFDMGQDFAGRARLHVSGPAGTQITLRYGERLRPDGTLHRDQIQGLVYEGPFQTEVYILKGKGAETWESRFTYHGFRYVEMTGFPGKPTAANLEGRVMHTGFPMTGSFACSNPLLNAIQRLTLWSYQSNFMGIPTDCPHREKNGWTGDAQLAADQAMYNVENAAAYSKWMNDFDDVQKENGELPGIVPTWDWGYGTGPAWDSAYILIPWDLYVYRGDKTVLAGHYDRMCRYLDYLTGRANDHIVDYGLGDWVPYKTDTPAAITSTGYYYVDTLILSRVAHVLGREADATRYTALAAQIREAFNHTFYHGGGHYANDSQTALSTALYQGLVDPQNQSAVLAQLAANLERQVNHLDTGILGAKYVFHALSDNGRNDLAYRVATGTTTPSYGDWVRRGATTLWEDWNGASSLNHIMFGDISAWFYQELAGIHPDPERPGFKHVLLRPRPTGDLSWAKGSTETPYGLVVSHWQIQNGVFDWSVVVPPNTTATVWVPTRDANSVLENGKPARNGQGIQFLRSEGGAAVFEVASGSYRFEAQ